jgi:hypothetical protein
VECHTVIPTNIEQSVTLERIIDISRSTASRNVEEGYLLNVHSDYSRDSSVGISLGYGLDDRDFRVRFPGGGGAGNFSLHHRFQNGSKAHPASYPMGTGVSFPGGKAARA